MRRIALLFLLLLVMLTGCRKAAEDRIVIAEQFGLAYAPVQIMRLQGLIEKRVPSAEVVYEQLGNTAAIREAMISGHLDIGFGAIPPFLIGVENGMDWRLASGVSQVPVGLVTLDQEKRSISDLREHDKVALPQPGSIQHMLLSMAAERDLGSAGLLDDRMVTMSHPDGFQALAAGAVTAHFTTPPYIFNELDLEGAHLLLSGTDAFGGDFTFIVGYATEAFHDENGELYAAFIEALEEAIDFMSEQPKEAARLLSGVYEIPDETIYEYITADGMVYTPGITGLERFGAFMHEQGYLEEPVPVASSLVWEHP